MAKHTIKGYIVWERWKNSGTADFKFQPYPAAKESDYYVQVPVCEHELTFEIPAGFDPRAAEVESLQKMKQEIRAAFAARITEIDKRISELQAITFDAGAA